MEAPRPTLPNFMAESSPRICLAGLWIVSVNGASSSAISANPCRSARRTAGDEFSRIPQDGAWLRRSGHIITKGQQAGLALPVDVPDEFWVSSSARGRGPKTAQSVGNRAVVWHGWAI